MICGLISSQIKEVVSIFKKYRAVERAAIYGSRATGLHRKYSDVDVALFGKKGLTIDVLCDVANDLEDTYLPYMFDVTLFKMVTKSDMRKHILRDGVTIYHRGVAIMIPPRGD